MTMRVAASQMRTRVRPTLSRVRRRLRAEATRRLGREVVTAPGPVPAALWVFTGTEGATPGIGRELYRAEPVFRESVEASARAMSDRHGIEIGESFRGGPETAEEDRALAFARIGAVQIGLCDLWRSLGAPVAATLGIGLGEVAAAYAAGALDRDDAAAVAGALARSLARGARPGVAFTAEVDREGAQRLCAAAPAELRLLGSLAPHRCRLWAPDAGAAAARGFLAEHVQLGDPEPAPGSEHTAGASEVSALESALAGVVARPVRCRIFSAAAGGELHGARFDAPHWDWVISRPFSLPEAARPALELARRLVIGIGPDAGASEAIGAAAAALGAQPILVRTLPTAPDAGELAAWQAAIGGVRSLGTLSRPDAAAALEPPSAPERPRATPATLLLDDPVVAQDPFVHYEDLRDDGPVQFLTLHDAWIVLGHEEVVAALSRPQLYSSQITAPVDPVLLGSDGRPHAQVRRALAPAFSAEAVNRLAPELDAFAPTVLDALVQDGEIDVVRQFASPLAYYVGARLLELDTDTAATVSFAVGDAEAEPVTLIDRLSGVAELLREQSGLVARLRERHDLDETQIDSLLRLLWVASTATTKRVIASAVRILAEDLPLRRRLIDDPGLIPPFVEEAVRLHPPELVTLRITTDDTVLGGTAIPGGSVLLLCLAAANRDPRRYASPGEFRLDRTATHLAFGSGSHGCPGSAVARAEARSAIAALLQLAPDFCTPQPPCMLRYLPAMSTHGLQQLVIARSPSAAGSGGGR